MTYKPTKEELDELGFKDWTDNNNAIYLSEYPKCEIYENSKIVCSHGRFFIGGEIEIYPQSKSEIETLIRLFTNPNE